MLLVIIPYNGFCCVPGPVNNSAIFGSRKNRMSCVTDHTKEIAKETILLSIPKKETILILKYLDGLLYYSKWDLAASLTIFKIQGALPTKTHSKLSLPTRALHIFRRG